MRNQIIRWAGLALLAVVVVGCDDDTPEPRITVNQHVKDFMTGDPLTNVTVCIHGRSDLGCATSDAAGNYSLEIPADQDLSFTYERSDYWPMLVEARSPAEDWNTVDDMAMNSELEVGILLASANITPDSAKGHLLVSIFDSASVADATTVTDVSIAIDGGGGTIAYVTENNLMDTDLTGTTFRGGAVVINADPGVYTVTLSHPTLTCKPIYAIAGAQTGTFRATIIPVAVTWLNAYCD